MQASAQGGCPRTLSTSQGCRDGHELMLPNPLTPAASEDAARAITDWSEAGARDGRGANGTSPDQGATCKQRQTYTAPQGFQPQGFHGLLGIVPSSTLGLGRRCPPARAVSSTPCPFGGGGSLRPFRQALGVA